MSRFVLFSIFLMAINVSYAQNYLRANAEAGDGLRKLMERYEVNYNECTRALFLKLNNQKDESLQLNVAYQLPVKVYKYNGKSIRSTINNNDYEYAVAIQDYNNRMQKAKIKAKSYKDDKELWVIESCTDEVEERVLESQKASGKGAYPIFGPGYDDVEIVSNRLKGKVFYLVSGHGGPDPGAISQKEGQMICEDEFAYDVILRLGRYLISEGGLVYIVVRDDNDGIRDTDLLDCDYDENCAGNSIPLNQTKRLHQRAYYINKLYKENKAKGYKEQVALEIHIDSNNKNKNIDVFFYHHEKSVRGKEIANNVFATFKENYDKYQKGRGYEGSVSSRNLYMITQVQPIALYIELGNIQNPTDHKRLVSWKNREALAKWIFQGLTK